MDKLTRAEILAEPAGRKLDKWVAEFVMGQCVWTGVAGHGIGEVDHYNTSCGSKQGYRSFEKPHCPSCNRIVATGPGAYDAAAHYSTDIVPAMQVVNLMAHRMWRLVWLPDAKLWQSGFIDESPVNEIETMDIPLGVCRCALLAVIGEA